MIHAPRGFTSRPEIAEEPPQKNTRHEMVPGSGIQRHLPLGRCPQADGRR
jgi:hypothetical protein